VNQPYIYYRGGGMDAACWATVQGSTVCSTKGFWLLL